MTQILKNVSLQLHESKTVVLIGKNGAGKTTLLKILYKFQKQNSGTIELFGEKDYSLQKFGIVPQENYFDNDLNVYYNLYYHLKSMNIFKKSEIEQQIDRKLQFVGALSLKHRNFDELSGGEKRKIALARSLLHEPALLLLDEPTEGVDMQSKLQFWQNLQTLKQSGVSILLTTHHYDEMEAIADDVVLLSNSNTQYLGKIKDFNYSNLLDIFGKENEENEL